METKQTTAKERVEIELAELCDKMVGLTKFLYSDKVKTLSKEAETLLKAQLGAMQEYADILKERLNIWED